MVADSPEIVKAVTRANKRLDSATNVARWLPLFLEPNQVFEVRVLNAKEGGRKNDFTGFYQYQNDKSLVDAAYAALSINDPAGVYFSFNPLNPDLLALRRGIAPAERGVSATDKAVQKRRWLMIDVDPDRLAGISSSDSEKMAAWEVATEIKNGLGSLGFPAPIVADSGNGYHLFYRVDLPTDDNCLTSRVLQSLAARYDTEHATVDTKTFNASRITKLYGTRVAKGVDTKDRPHRYSAIIEVPGCDDLSDISQACLTPVPLKLLERVAADAPRSSKSSAPRPRSGSASQGSRLKIDEYLRDCGIEFRISEKSQDTWYQFTECPFNSHPHPYHAALIQSANGPVCFTCWHNSCKDYKFQDLKKKIGKPEPHHWDPPLVARSRRVCAQDVPSEIAAGVAGGAATGGDGASEIDDGEPANLLPRIQCGDGRQNRDVLKDAMDAIRRANSPPTIFQRGRILTRLLIDPKTSIPKLDPMRPREVGITLTERADWYKLKRSKQGDYEEDVRPPNDLAADITALPAYDGIPLIESVAECPVFSNNGELVTEQGYHERAELWLHSSVSVNVPEDPSTDDIDRARDLILSELLADFPFADEASRANTVAALILPAVRRMIDGPTPLHLYDAPVEGTGKTLLVTAIAYPYTGRPIPAMAEARDDEEWRKRITAALSEAPTFIFLDNLNRFLDSGALASALTSRTWTDRILGVSKTACLPNNAIWLASGNNVTLSRELVRRTIWTRLDSRTDAPWERNGFRHPNLLGWLRENRAHVLSAILTLVQAWLRRGRPAGPETLGMFESWAHTIGGILQVAGIPGLLGNAKAFRIEGIENHSEWRAFVLAWHKEHACRVVGVAKLFSLVARENLLDQVIGDGGEQSQRSRFGHGLRKMLDRVFTVPCSEIPDEIALRIRGAKDDNSGRKQYRLEVVGEPASSPAPSPAQSNLKNNTPVGLDDL